MSLKVAHDREPDITLRFDGAIVSKKNSYSPAGGMFRKTTKIRNFEQMISYQIDPAHRDLKLNHPEVVFSYSMPIKSWGGDRDNIWTSLVDVLVMNGVFANDSTHRFNGTVVIMPVTLSKDYHATVDIWLSDGDKDKI